MKYTAEYVKGKPIEKHLEMVDADFDAAVELSLSRKWSMTVLARAARQLAELAANLGAEQWCSGRYGDYISEHTAGNYEVRYRPQLLAAVERNQKARTKMHQEQVKTKEETRERCEQAAKRDAFRQKYGCSYPGFEHLVSEERYAQLGEAASMLREGKATYTVQKLFPIYTYGINRMVGELRKLGFNIPATEQVSA
jgi:hypothetical protein